MEDTVEEKLEGSQPVGPIIWTYSGKTRGGQTLSGKISAPTEEDALSVVANMGIQSAKIIENNEGKPLKVSRQEPLPEELVVEAPKDDFIKQTGHQDKAMEISPQIGRMVSATENRTSTSRRESVFFGDYEVVRAQSEEIFSSLRGRTKHVAMQSDCHGKVQILLVVEHDQWKAEERT